MVKPTNNEVIMNKRVINRIRRLKKTKQSLIEEIMTKRM